jgi:hypothetical protein
MVAVELDSVLAIWNAILPESESCNSCGVSSSPAPAEQLCHISDIEPAGRLIEHVKVESKDGKGKAFADLRQ